jgi:hypothetical protein
MTRRGLLEAGLWGAAVLVTLWSAFTWHPWEPSPPGRALAESPPPAVRRAAEGVLAGAARTVVERNPFRLDRRPATVAFGAMAGMTEMEAYADPEPEHPAPVVRGIVGGPPWEALLEGIPGRDGSLLVRPGDVLGELRVRSISRDTVVVQGTDITWKLTLKPAWQ